MSFVIMVANNVGMACATDSRSTLGNDWFPQVENDETTKAFKMIICLLQLMVKTKLL